MDSAGRARYPSAFCPASSTNALRYAAMTIGIRWVGGNIGWIGGRPAIAEGSRSPAHSARMSSIAFETPSTAASGS